ncbi:LOW QUALITY PROTEIN: NACHT and ankyrin domain protein [Colletotrichum tofieldiae]|nr:LOW QUALITY PROTEIN: NACHT and ankyrin domain protein [Colletotrichum tofieldiae]
MTMNPRATRREDFEVAVICAVHCEYDAVAFAFDEIWEGDGGRLGNASGDHNIYTTGRIGGHDVVLLLLPSMGKVSAASAAASLRSTYTGIKLAILTGICGGVPGVETENEILLGDVVISKSIVQYDLGRKYPHRFALKETIEESLGRPNKDIRSLVAIFETRHGRNNLQRQTSQIMEQIQQRAIDDRHGNLYKRPTATEDRLFEPDYPHRHRDSRGCGCGESGACEKALSASCEELGCDVGRLVSKRRLKKRTLQDHQSGATVAPELRVFVGRVGSGDTVMKSGLDRDRTAREHDLIAFEMEGAGVWDEIPCIVVKAVCDYADIHKNKNWQNFAAARAASTTKALLERYPSTDRRIEIAGWNDWEGQARNVDHRSNRYCHSMAPVEGRETRRDEELRMQEIQQPTVILEEIDPVPKDRARHVPKQHDENERRLLQMLAANHEAYKNFNPRRVAGTCEWFFKDYRFRNWLGSTTSSIIWVSAGPGCGKSVLARALVDEGRLSSRPETTTVCYFFFNDGEERRTNSCDALAAILHQLFTQRRTGPLIRHATSSLVNYGDGLRNNFQQLWQTLKDCAKNSDAGEIVCVLDALDECNKDSRQEILEVLESFYFGDQLHQSASRLKFLITSRPYDDLETSFENFTTSEAYIRFDGDDKSEEIRHEIDLVIDHKVNDFGKDFRDEHRQEISDRLKAMENRTYLWLHLTLNIINKTRSAYRKPSSIQTLLSHLPSGVFDAYERILSRNQDEKQTRGLLGIVLAAKRPLTLDEYYKYDDLEASLWPRNSFKSTVQNLCGLFISVYDNKVSFIHQTAREFLTSNPAPQKAWQGSFDMPSSHSTIFVSCARLLSLQDFDRVARKRFGHEYLPFFVYAAVNWTFHYNSQNGGQVL